ncbi:hypothetical protein [Paenibacillus monticola]|nr:hypothetical protein [Paenibacillus monticola]
MDLFSSRFNDTGNMVVSECEKQRQESVVLGIMGDYNDAYTNGCIPAPCHFSRETQTEDKIMRG